MFVEGCGLVVLLVDVGGEGWVEAQGVFDERAACSGAVVGGIDEERLPVRAVEEHEADGMIARVDGEPERGLRQEGVDLRFDGLAVGGGEEVVRCIDCPAPDFQYAVCVGMFCLADVDQVTMPWTEKWRFGSQRKPLMRGIFITKEERILDVIMHLADL